LSESAIDPCFHKHLPLVNPDRSGGSTKKPAAEQKTSESRQLSATNHPLS
jgi:hypothetical protein